MHRLPKVVSTLSVKKQYCPTYVADEAYNLGYI